MEIIMINAMWCPGCIVMHKVWNSIKEKYDDIKFISYDYDMDEDIVKDFNPGSVLPITIFIKGGKEIERVNGEAKEEDLISIIEKYK